MDINNIRHGLIIFVTLFNLVIAQNIFAQKTDTPTTFHLILSQTGSCSFPSSPYISNNTIFIGDYSGIMSAIDQNTALFKWRYRAYERYQCLSTVASDNDSIYFTAGSASYSYSSLYGLTKATGVEQWNLQGGSVGEYTPVVADNNLIFYGDKYEFTAVNKKTGKKEWNFVDIKMKFSPPVIYKDDIIFGASDIYHHRDSHGVYSLDKLTGDVKWTFDGERKTNNDGEVLKEGFLNSPCMIDDNIYASGSFGNIYAIDAKNGTLKWKYKYETDNPQDTAVCYGDTVYVGTNVNYHKGALYAVDAHTGRLRWQYNTAARVYTPHVNGNAIYFGTREYPPYPASSKSFLYALDLQGKFKWKFEADGSIVSAPITNRGIVYFTTLAGSIYGIHEETGKL